MLLVLRYGLTGNKKNHLINKVVHNDILREFLQLCFVSEKDEFFVHGIRVFSSLTYGDNSDIYRFLD